MLNASTHQIKLMTMMSASIKDNTPKTKNSTLKSQGENASTGVRYCDGFVYPKKEMEKTVREVIESMTEDGLLSSKLANRDSYERKKKYSSKKKQRAHERKLKKCAKNGKFNPHFGLEMFNVRELVMSIIVDKVGARCADDIISEVEGIVALMVSITKTKDMTGVLASLFLYLKSRYKKSLSSILIGYIMDLFKEGIQDGPEDEVEPSWLKFIKNLRSDWKSCVGDGLFGIFSKILGLLVVAGLTKVSDLDFSIKGVKILEPDFKVVSGKATDLVTAVCDIVVFFCERCWASWKTGSLRPLFSASAESAQMEVKYSTLLTQWDLYRNGNLMKIDGVSEHDFLHNLEEMALTLKSMMSQLKGIEKRLIEDKFRVISRIISDFNTIRLNSGFKKAPFSLQFYGASKVGKSTAMDQITTYLLTSAGMSTDEGRRYVQTSGKKHWDGAKSDMLVLVVDDHGNTKEQFVEVSPCDVIIRVCNNVPYGPPMADVGEKGKVFPAPWLFTLSTNVLDLLATIYSKEPYSIQRRMHYVLRQTPKEEYTEKLAGAELGIDTAKVIASHTKDGIYSPPTLHDVWWFDILVVVPTQQHRAGKYVIHEHEGKKMERLSIYEVCNFLADQFHKHIAEQEALEKSHSDGAKGSVKCSHEGCHQLKGYCLKHDKVQFGLESVQKYWDSFKKTSNDSIEDVRAMMRDARYVYAKTDWVPFVPNWVIDSRVFRWSYMLFNRSEFYKAYKQRSCVNIACCLSAACGAFALPLNIGFLFVVLAIIAVIGLMNQLVLLTVVKNQAFAKLKDRKVLNEIQEHHQATMVKMMIGSGIALGVLYQFVKAVKLWRKMNAHSFLNPTGEDEIRERDESKNVWCSVAKRELPLTEVSKHMNAEQMMNLVQKSLLYGSVHLDGCTAMVNGLMLRSNVILIPDHYFEQHGDSLHCTFRKKNPEANGGKFTATVEKAASVRLPNSDLRVCYVPNGGTFRDLSSYFPEAELPSVPFRMVWRRKDGEYKFYKGVTKPGEAETICKFIGGTYKSLDGDTFRGLCGATLVSDTKGSAIIGVHLGGIEGTPRGCYGSITRSKIDDAFEELRKCEGVFLTGAEGKFEPQVLGVNVLRDNPLHVKSALNYMPEGSQIEYYGSCIGRSSATDTVKVTPISQHIMDVCGVPNVYRGPKLNPEWFGWQSCLANMSLPAKAYPYKLLKTCVEDYKSALIPIFSREYWRATRPLNDVENVNGIAGRRFIDAINIKSSIGLPLSGPKSKFIVEDEEGVRSFEPSIQKEIERVHSCYKRGERGYALAKACKKIEILSKDKCRIFYGNAISLTYLVRKYYLPILRVLQMNPLVSECAVGINSHGPEWEEFHNHVFKFGGDRLIGGDYGKYDQKLPAQLILASLRILTDFARICDYTDEDIRVMEAMAGDIVYAYIAFNGDLIGLTEGTHISGNSLTVIINGICGSLNLRAYFYSENVCDSFEERKPFRDYVSLMTYGDDNIGSVSSEITNFTIKGCSDFLDTYGQVYTMPDKESELVDFLPLEEFEFLKRKSVYHESLGCHLGALIDPSIYKSLHCFLREKNSPLTEEQACAENIDGALMEWFNHGKNTYESMRGKMREVAKRAGISHMCAGLDMSYEDRIENWHENYGEDI